jgi:serine/threonine protein kinase
MRGNPFKTNMTPDSIREKYIQDFIGRCLEYDPAIRIDWNDIMRHPIMKDTLLEEMMDFEMRNTMSGDIVNPDRIILEKIFKNFQSIEALEHTVLHKLIMTRKKVVVIETIFIDFVDSWLRKFLNDGASTMYKERKCLAPIIGHLAVHIKEIICLIVDKQKSKEYANHIITEADINVLTNL